jgi:predicted amidohydrolase
MARLSVIQLNSTPNVAENIDKIHHLLAQLPNDEAHVVLLPECCLFFGGKDSEQLALAQRTKDNKYLIKTLAEIATLFQVTLVGGSIPVLTTQGDKFYNTSYVFSPAGKELANYQKIHLFDVQVDDSEKNYFESNVTQAGNRIVVADTDVAKIGLSICYDLRFPELYRALQQQGADVITVPSAFTSVTGQAHWLALLQARAIENQVYIMAAGQEGIHKNGRKTWGHSMIISPWGEVMVCHDKGEGIASVEYMPELITDIRIKMPVHRHNKFSINFKGE